MLQVMVPEFDVVTQKVTGFAPVQPEGQDGVDGAANTDKYFVVVDESHHVLAKEKDALQRGQCTTHHNIAPRFENRPKI